MSTLRAHLTQLETRLQSLVEGSAQRLFPGGMAPQDLSFRLVEALERGARTGPQGESIAPDLFVLEVSLEQAGALQSDATFVDGLARLVEEAGVEMSMTYVKPVSVRINGQPALAPGDLRVSAWHTAQDLPETAAVRVVTKELPGDSGAEFPEGAFLIVDGARLYPLTHPVVNIGRRSDNQLVLDDRRVSRLHAQLRLVRGRFEIFDLNSAGGTWVNGQRVRQRALSPGDVISLGGVPVVFSQENPALGETEEYHPASPGKDQG